MILWLNVPTCIFVISGKCVQVKTLSDLTLIPDTTLVDDKHTVCHVTVT